MANMSAWEKVKMGCCAISRFYNAPSEYFAICSRVGSKATPLRGKHLRCGSSDRDILRSCGRSIKATTRKTGRSLFLV